jgi:hypothetical protein
VARRYPRPSLSEAENKLFQELCVLRERGLFDPHDRVHELQRLVDIARGLPGDSDRARVEKLLRQELLGMGSVFGPALLMMFGIAPAARGKTARERDALAHREFCKAERASCASSNEARPPKLMTFATHTKDKMLENLARRLERRVQAERQRQRAEFERRLRDRGLAGGSSPAHTEKDKGAATDGGTGIRGSEEGAG